MLQASLKVIGGKNDGKVIEFKTRKFLVGREQDCHLRPNSDLVSRHHCVFTIDDYAVRLRDLGSTNGTLVNGRRIRGETVLTPGDVVRIGKLNLEIVIGSSEAAGAEVQPSAANQETTNKASSLDTSFDMPSPQTNLDDSGVVSSPSGDTAQFQVSPTASGDEGSGDAIPAESDTLAAGATDQTLTDAAPQPGQPQAPPAQHPGEAVPPNAWQYPQYPQFPPYQYPPQGYMGYPPPGYPPGYGYPPQQMGYPPNYQQPGSPPPPTGGSDSSHEIPEIRLPNPEETGIHEESKAPAPEKTASDQSDKSNESTPSQRAADLINARRRRSPD